MSNRSLQSLVRKPLAAVIRHLEPVTRPDASGYALYADGEIGAAHVFAHRMLDEGCTHFGHAVLGRWLSSRTGRGGQWVHIQWHMAVFELGLGCWHDALARFQREIRPYAFATEDALTDAPSLLWRLRLSTPDPVPLPWTEAHRTACRNLRRARTPYIQLHNLLALCGAGDLTMLDRWLERMAPAEGARAEQLLWRMGRGLRAYAAGAYLEAAHILAETVPSVSEIGGSRAQNELFHELRRDALRRAAPEPVSVTPARAA